MAPFEDLNGKDDGFNGSWNNNRGAGKHTYNSCQDHYDSDSDSDSDTGRPHNSEKVRAGEDYMVKNSCTRCEYETPDLTPGYMKKHHLTCRSKFTVSIITLHLTLFSGECPPPPFQKQLKKYYF
jgi:hypothetical protein